MCIKKVPTKCQILMGSAGGHSRAFEVQCLLGGGWCKPQRVSGWEQGPVAGRVREGGAGTGMEEQTVPSLGRQCVSEDDSTPDRLKLASWALSNANSPGRFEVTFAARDAQKADSQTPQSPQGSAGFQRCAGFTRWCSSH